MSNRNLGTPYSIYDRKNNDRNNNNDGSALIGLAICHYSPRTEAGSGTCYIKFGSIRPTKNALKHFHYLLDLCASFAKTQGLSCILAVANTARHNAYRMIIERNFLTDLQGIAMDRPNEVGYCIDEVYLIDE